MIELIKSGGWLMLPIVACSVISLAIIIERSLVLRRRVVMPEGLVADIDRALGRGSLTPDRIALLRRSSPLGRVLAAGLASVQSHPGRISEAFEEAGRHVVHDLERYLNALGTIAATTPHPKHILAYPCAPCSAGIPCSGHAPGYAQNVVEYAQNVVG